MTTTIDTIDYSDNLAASVILSRFARKERAAADEFAAYPAIAAHAISQAEACERVAAALDRMRERS